MGRNQLRKIPVDSEYRIQIEALETTIKADRDAGLQPFCLIGNAGTVNTGVVDPLDALAGIAERHNLWLHVDGAYGDFPPASLRLALLPPASPIYVALTLTG